MNKQLILLGMDNGDGKPIVKPMPGGIAITFSVNGITLDGFVATNGNTGINVTSSNNFIKNNIVQGNTGAYGDGNVIAGGRKLRKYTELKNLKTWHR